MRPTIFITQPIPEKALRLLEEHGEVQYNPDAKHILSKPELLEAVQRNDYLYCLISDAIDADVIRANPRLKVIASMAITPSGIDVAEATANKIPVTIIPPMVTEATADLTWALILAVARRLVNGDRGLRSGIFPGGQSMHYTGSWVCGKTLGIIGMGRIGEAVARRAVGFRMPVLYCKRKRLPPEREAELQVRYVPLDALLAQSDFVTLLAAYTPETHHLVGARELGLMKASAYLINTSRGPVVDEKALVAALRRGTIAGAGLDVYEREPRVDPGLIELENTVLTPHLGSAVDELRDEMAMIVAENLIAVIEGRRPANLCNPEIYS